MTLIDKYSARPFFFAILFAFIGIISSAQVIDSLKNVLKSAKEDTAKVNALSSLAWEFSRIDKYDESLPYINEGIVLAEKLKHTRELGNLLRRSGDYYKSYNNYSKALQEYTKALNVETLDDRKPKMAICYDRFAKLYIQMGEYSKAALSMEDVLRLYEDMKDTLKTADALLSLWDLQYKKIDDAKRATSYLERVHELLNKTSNDTTLAYLCHKLGVFYSNEGDFEKAAEYLNKSLSLHQQQNNQKEIAEDYFNIGGLYEEAGNYHKLLEYSLKILKIRESRGDKSAIAASSNNVGWAYQLIGNFPKALEYQLKSYKYYIEAGDDAGAAYPIGNLGIIYNQLGAYEKAIEYSVKAKLIFEKSKDMGGVAESYNNMGNAYVNLGKYKMAEEYLTKGLALAKELTINYEIKNSYAGLSLCYEKMGDYKKAYQHYKLFTQVRDTIVNQENSDRVSKMNFSIENEKNQKAIELLNKNTLLNEAELQRQRTLTYSAIGGVLLTISLMFFVFRGYTQKKRSSEQLLLQKIEIEKSYQSTKLLSEIGREITASLSVEKIIQNVYKNINTLMDASSFWIGIYNVEKQSLDYPMGIEKGQVLPFASYSLSEEERLPVWSFKNKKEVIVNDYIRDYQKYIPSGRAPKPIVGDRPESSIWCPLISKDNKAIGILTVQSFQKEMYTQYHLSLVRSLAVFTAIALENALLHEEVEQKVIERTVEVVKQKEEIEQSYRNTKRLSDIGREITTSLSVEEIVEKVYENVNTLMDASVLAIGIHDPDKNVLNFPGDIEKGEKLPFAYEALIDDSRTSVWCFKNQKEIFINDIKKDYPKYFPGREIPPPTTGEQTESIIYFPLTIPNKKIGVITVQSFKRNAYTEYHLDIIRNLAIYVTTALENARLYGNMEAEVKERTVEIEKQKEELAKLSIVASETDNAIIIADAQGNIEWVNASYTRLTGYSLEDLKASNRTSIMAVSGNPKIKEILDDCIRKSKSTVYEVMNKAKDGREIWVQTTLTPITGEDGKIRNLVAIDSDITELKRVETEIKQQHAVISEKNKHITDSINYAKRIQDAILPHHDMVKSMLPDAFVLYKPKDIVSGDFYWITEKADKLFFAVVDCTGHGVPGAFVSIIGYNGLYRSVNEFGLSKPSEILDKLNELVEETFGQNNKTHINDGMDIALCSYDRKTRELEFSGANNPLYIISKGEFTEIKGDKQPIGAFDHRKKFTNHSINLKKEDSIYIFSDGYADQFGGITKKKFKYNQFKTMLASLNGTPMLQQKDILNNTIVNWMGDLEQVDDICVIGVKI